MRFLVLPLFLLLKTASPNIGKAAIQGVIS